MMIIIITDSQPKSKDTEKEVARMRREMEATRIENARECDILNAEIERLNAWAVDYHKLMREEHLKAESRLAAADALLRKTLSYVSVGICAEIQAHLCSGDMKGK